MRMARCRTQRSERLRKPGSCCGHPSRAIEQAHRPQSALHLPLYRPCLGDAHGPGGSRSGGNWGGAPSPGGPAAPGSPCGGRRAGRIAARAMRGELSMRWRAAACLLAECLCGPFLVASVEISVLEAQNSSFAVR